MLQRQWTSGVSSTGSSSLFSDVVARRSVGRLAPLSWAAMRGRGLLQPSAILRCRPGADDASLANLGSLGPFAKAEPVPEYLRRKFRLMEQKHMRNDVRERRYALCKKCGVTTMTVNFDRVPSARLGLFGQCKDGQDYTHHQYATITEKEYHALQNVPMAERLTWHLFDSGLR